MHRPATIAEASSCSAHEQPHIFQDPSQLVFALYVGDGARDFDASGLTIVQQAALRSGAITIEAAILGASHFVSVRAGDRVLAVELFACVDATSLGAPPSELVRYRSDSDLHVAADSTQLAVAAIVRTEHRWWNHAPAAKPAQRALTLVESFPGASSPRTIVGVRSQACSTSTRVWIDTIHEYALADRVVAVTSATLMTIRDVP